MLHKTARMPCSVVKRLSLQFVNTVMSAPGTVSGHQHIQMCWSLHSVRTHATFLGGLLLPLQSPMTPVRLSSGLRAKLCLV
jgi:hypothetical protein